MSSFSNILEKFKNKSLFDASLLIVEKELVYGVFSDDPENADDIRKSLDQLINNLAIDHIIPFTAKASENITLGKKLNCIHPLTTFEFFLSTDERKKKIYHIYDQKRCQTSLLNPYGWVFAYLKDESIKSYAFLLEKRHANKDLVCHIDTFSKNTGLDKHKEKFIEIITDEKSKDQFIKFVKLILENRSLD